jgi:hypothetical protein
MKTKYGLIIVTEETGVKKLDYMSSKFKSNAHFLRFLKDTELLKKIFGY